MTEKTSFVEGLTKRHLIELDACTRCSECLKWCPVQEVTGNRGISPPEKIRMYRDLINNTEGLKARLFGPRKVNRELLEEFAKAVFECTTCGACGESCEVGIFSQRLWPFLRKKMVDMGLGPLGPQANLPKVIERTGNPYDKPAEERYRPWFPQEVKVAGRAEIGYYAGCTGAYESQAMVRGDVLALGAIGEPFTMLPPEEEVCCGFPLFITGQHDRLEDLTRRLVDAYRIKGVKLLISSCPCCVNIMARDWPLFYGQELPFKIRHITQFVADAIKDGKFHFKEGLKEKLIYHDPCYLSRGVGVTEEPRFVLKSIPGVELIEFDRSGLDSRCCGAGGAARKVFHDNAIAMGRLTIDEAVGKGADRLVLSCPACYSKVNEAMEGYDKQIRIVDIMELIAELISGD
ncbi:anaerobic glycerol-3-phosphate dehydrogenase subunit C [bacterium BMS3Abin07]|nr:anaerobic glycerol-3-phosphate dehydrogenase subunit C [bacterium BMS3Abin07]